MLFIYKLFVKNKLENWKVEKGWPKKKLKLYGSLNKGRYPFDKIFDELKKQYVDKISERTEINCVFALYLNLPELISASLKENPEKRLSPP